MAGFWMPEQFRRRYRHYTNLALTTSPQVIWRMARRKAALRWQRDIGRLRIHLMGTGISDREFTRACRTRYANPDFFLMPERQEQLISSLRTHFPSAQSTIIAAADRACAHVFDLLGSGPTPVGCVIDWHADFKTGYRWNPRQYYADVRCAAYPGGYDVKVPWELSRCQHFVWLGQAYWFTDDEKYAREFVAEVEDWIASNPWPWGVNWACTMDVAIRAVNWLWGYAFFEDSPTLTDNFRLVFYKSLLVHGRHIFRNLENQGSVTSNHYLSNLVGLAYLGILCPEFKEAAQWREFGLRELEQEMFKQVYPDGVDFEASTSYHRLVLEMFLSATILAQRNGHTFSQAYMQRLEKMVEFAMYVTQPDGTVPLIGDNDSGRLHRLKVWDPPEREWVDFRYLLAIGAVLFRRHDFAQAAGDQWEEVVWLLGDQAAEFFRSLDAKPSPPQSESRAFMHSGMYVMRHADISLVVDAGPVGQNGSGGHAHNDALSFTLHAGGVRWIVDPGTATYTADYSIRNAFRSTSYHNTVLVGGKDQHDTHERDCFRMPCRGTEPKALDWGVTTNHVGLVAEHYGYARLPRPVVHRRMIFLDRVESVVIVRDHLTNGNEYDLRSFMHLHPCLTAHHYENGFRVVDPDGRCLCIVPLYSPGCSGSIVSTSFAPGYGVLQPGIAIEWAWCGAQESTVAIALEPRSSAHIERAYMRASAFWESTG